MSEEILLSEETEWAIIEAYHNVDIKNKEICEKFNLSPPRLYRVLNKYNIPYKGFTCRTRFNDDDEIKCSKCHLIKKKDKMSISNGVPRTMCKKCHASLESLRRDKMSKEKKKELSIKYSKTKREKYINGSLNLIPIEEQISLWINKVINRTGEVRFLARKFLDKEKLLKKCLEAKEKFPELIFCFVQNTDQERAWIASLDRINAFEDYSDDNIQIIPLWLNSAKLQLTQEKIDDIMFKYIAAHPKFSPFINIDEYFSHCKQLLPHSIS